METASVPEPKTKNDILDIGYWLLNLQLRNVYIYALIMRKKDDEKDWMLFYVYVNRREGTWNLTLKTWDWIKIPQVLFMFTARE